MTAFDRFSMSTGIQDELLKIARQATQEELRRMARNYDWNTHPEAVLGWVMSQRSIDLSSALEVFFNGDPERFNYLAKRDVPQQHRGATRVLDNICLRVNSGFYRLRPAQNLESRSRLEKWLEFQHADRVDGRRGRWIFEEGIAETALTGKRPVAMEEDAPDMEAIRPLKGPGAVHAFVSELVGRRLGARILKFLPRQE